MSGSSTYAANAFLNWHRGVAMPAAPAGIYVAIYNGDPGNDGLGGTDVTDDVSATGRVAATFGAPADKRIENDAVVEFGASASTVNVTHFGLWDAQVDGNFLGSNSLQTARAVTAGDPVSFLAGDLAVNINPK